MRSQPSQHSKILFLVLALACAGAPAVGQSLMQAHGVVIAANEQAPYFTSIATGNPFSAASVDTEGNVVFRAGNATTLRSLYFGSSASDLSVQAAPFTQAPGMAPGIMLNNAASTIGESPRISDTGLVMWFASLLPDPAAGVVSTNDTVIFAGTPGGYAPWVREGDVMPGTSGATLTGDLSNPGHQSTGLTDGYRILFRSTLAGGDVSGTTNDEGWISGTAGALEFVQRKGDVVLGGAVVGSLGFVSQINASGQVLHDESLSTTVGTAFIGNDATLWIYTPGAGNTLVVREGSAAPGTVGATFFNGSGTWNPGISANAFNANGDVVFTAELAGGDAVAGVNDSAVYVGNTSSLNMIMRKSVTPLPGTDGYIKTVNNASLNLNNAGQIAFQASIVGGTQTTANDTGLWAGLPGSLTLVMREGDPAPGTVGAVFESSIALPMQFNDEGQVLFQATLTGGDVTPGVNSSAIYLWDPAYGLVLGLRGGESIVTVPSTPVVKTVLNSGGVQFNNGNGTALGFNNKWWVTKVNFTDGTGAIMRVRLSSLTGLPKQISAVTGGTHVMQLNAGPAHAGELYWVVGSLSGSTPGIPFGPWTVPLNPDFYTQLMIDYANQGPFGTTLGVLDSFGRGNASLTLPPSLPIAGIIAHHAYVTLDVNLNVAFISEAASVEFTP